MCSTTICRRAYILTLSVIIYDCLLIINIILHLLFDIFNICFYCIFVSTTEIFD